MPCVVAPAGVRTARSLAYVPSKEIVRVGELASDDPVAADFAGVELEDGAVGVVLLEEHIVDNGGVVQR